MEKEKKVDFGFSVCIPIYNWNVVELVETIRSQSLSSECDFEILLIDDCSSFHKEENRKLQDLSYVNYTELERNIGRSAIRNMLGMQARYETLIFLDCDTKVVSDDYIKDYLAQSQFPVVVGGCVYDNICRDREHLFRWVYGRDRESRKALDRNVHPHESFSTFNFMIKKDVFLSVKFDENLSGYGHEDTLFGWELERRHVQVIHIDNPLQHLALDDAVIYIKKVESSIGNLWSIYQKIEDKNAFVESIKLLKCYLMLRRLRFAFLLKIGFSLVKKLLYRNFLSSRPSLFLFDIYKLGVLNEKASRS